MLLIGVLGVVGGGYALLNPLVSMKAFILLVAFEAIMARRVPGDARLQGAGGDGARVDPLPDGRRCRSCSESW